MVLKTELTKYDLRNSLSESRGENMYISRRAMYMVLLAVVCVLTYIIYPVDDSMLLFTIYTTVTALVVINVLITSYKNGLLIGFFSIANAFIALIFVARPIFLLLSESIEQYGNFRRYFLYYGYLSYVEMPWAQAALIGTIGTICLNIPFLYYRNQGKLAFADQLEYPDKISFDRNTTLGLFFFLVVGFASASLYGIKVLRSSSLHIYDLIWIFVFSCVFIYTITRRRKAGLYIYIIIALSMFLLSFRGRRQYAVNMLLCYICALYFAGKNRKRTLFRVGIMIIVAFIVVFVYGNVRRTLRGASIQESFFNGIIGEFTMFDMLLVCLKYKTTKELGLFWGYNYLSIFTIPIPGISVQAFDHRLTEIVFQGRFNGGIPTSIFGSLFFNFSYIGVFLGSAILGKTLAKLQQKLANIKDYDSIGYYCIFSTFVYDIVRVGDIGRETWSLISFLIVYYIFSSVMRQFNKGEVRI